MQVLIITSTAHDTVGAVGGGAGGQQDAFAPSLYFYGQAGGSAALQEVDDIDES